MNRTLDAYGRALWEPPEPRAVTRQRSDGRQCPNCESTNTVERQPPHIPTTIDCKQCGIVFCLTPMGVSANPDQPGMNEPCRRRMREFQRQFHEHMESLK
jgi:ribosomal protein L37AE/L43A